jgi:hypothetical protein
MAFRATAIVLLSFCFCSLVFCAAVPTGSAAQDAQNQQQAAASTIAEQPVAAESSYG